MLGWFLSIITMTGNGFIIFLVCSRRHLRTKTNAFIVSLGVADFCVGMNVVPSLFFLELIEQSHSKGLDKSLKLVRWLFQDASAMNMCILVLDRYIAVVKPLKYLTFMTSTRVIQLISFSWVVTVGIILVESSLLFTSNGKLVLIWLIIALFFFLPSVMIVLLRVNVSCCTHAKPNGKRLRKKIVFLQASGEICIDNDGSCYSLVPYLLRKLYSMCFHEYMERSM